ncbi:MAG TPA: SPOR domain-containing protein [Rhodobacteraceae bacterium]|nr:SPOR domain-containing protein [Paracoccaceae bacterium]
MADIEFDHSVAGDDPSPGFDLSKTINGLGALLSLALIAGLGWWGYHLLMRDVTGVPVIRALEGPMRVAPDDPGGASAEYQGLAVNNIAAVGEAEDPADRLVLAPKPTLLRPEDQTTQSLEALASATAEPAQNTQPVENNRPAEPEAQSADAQTGAEQAVEEVDQATLIEATLKQLTGEEPDPAAGSADVQTTRETQVAALDVVPPETPGVAKSLLPLVRPKTLAQPEPRPRTAALAGEGADNVPSVNPADIPPGTRLVQLGALDSIEIAKAEWLKIADRFEDFMAGKKRVIQKAQSGGKVFYRLRAHGFEDLSDARRFCSALLAGQANCIPLTTR